MHTKRYILFKGTITIITAVMIMAIASALYQMSVAPNIKAREGEIGKEKILNQTAQQSMASLMSESDSIRQELEQNKVENLQLQQELSDLKDISEQKALSMDLVIEAEELYKNGKYKTSRQKLAQVNSSILTAHLRVRYDQVYAQLRKKGV